MEKAKLSDIAKLAGVSKAAAGKVLNGGRTQIRVSEETRQRILAAAKQLHYQPNMAASILAGGQSKIIGVFIDSFAKYRTLRLLQEIEQVSTSLGYRIMTSVTHENIKHMKADYLAFQRYGITNFICCAHKYPDLQSEFMDSFSGENNIVFMEKPTCEGKRYAGTSRVKALTQMIAAAVRQGYRKIGMFSADLKWSTEAALYQEFHQAMRLNGLEPDPHLIAQHSGNLSLRTQTDAMMEQVILPYRPEVLYIDDALHASSLQTRLLERGIKVRIYGGNNDPLFEGLGLKSFDPCYRQIAQALLDLLLKPGCHGDMPVIEAVFPGN